MFPFNSILLEFFTVFCLQYIPSMLWSITSVYIIHVETDYLGQRILTVLA